MTNETYSLIKQELLKHKGINPIFIAKDIMKKEFISIHGPEHHFLDGGAFMIALKNAGLAFNLDICLPLLMERAEKMPGAMCGYWGVCGSCSSLGAVFSIIHNVGPLSDFDYYKDDMEFTSRVLSKMSKIGGPRCCKRNAFISIDTAIDFAKEKYGIVLEKEDIKCEFSSLNKQCLNNRCPFYNK